MKVYRPIKSDSIIQKFGENIAFVKLGADGKPLQPYEVVSTFGTCPPGYVPFYVALGMKGHNGWDSQAYHGEPVYFPVLADGIEWEAAVEVDPGGGIGVNVRSKQPVALEKLPPQAIGSLNMIKKQYDKLGGKVYLIFKFWHLDRTNIEYSKKPVKLGDLIGWADSTGASSGDHLHWSMKVSDETSWFSIDSDNGYTGAIDFADWFENKFVLDVINPPPPFRHEFKVPMNIGESSNEIRALQTALKIDGQFGQEVGITGYYGNITARAVLEFQIKYKVDTLENLQQLQGKRVGSKTMIQLNKLFYS